MNNSQRLWWEQAKSDHAAFVVLRRQPGVADCHPLHYLQMVTEKLAKAYFWRIGSPPPKHHAGFVQFLRFFGQIPPTDRNRIATLFGFNRFVDLQRWISSTIPIAYALERLAPALANDGPNPEYPWPHARPPNRAGQPSIPNLDSANKRRWSQSHAIYSRRCRELRRLCGYIGVASLHRHFFPMQYSAL